MKLSLLERLPSEPPACSLVITDGGSTETCVLWILSLNAVMIESFVLFVESEIQKLHS